MANGRYDRRYEDDYRNIRRNEFDPDDRSRSMSDRGYGRSIHGYEDDRDMGSSAYAADDDRSRGRSSYGYEESFVRDRDRGRGHNREDERQTTYGWGGRYAGSHPQREFERGDRGYGLNRYPDMHSGVGGYGDWRGQGRIDEGDDADYAPGYAPGYGGGYDGERRHGQSSERGGHGDRSLMSRIIGRFTGHGPKGYQRSDERIREDVCELLSDHGHIDAREIEIRVENREVTLEGTVTDRQQKRLAEDIAHDVRGVTDVHNHLRIRRAEQEATEREDGTQASLRH